MSDKNSQRSSSGLSSNAVSIRLSRSFPRSISSRSFASKSNMGGSPKFGRQRSRSASGGPPAEQTMYGPNGVFDLVWSTFLSRKNKSLELQPSPTHSDPSKRERELAISMASFLFS